MKFIDNIVKQQSKQNQIVCGDVCICEKTMESTEFVLCDGIGSGVYANIAAITCASRLTELFGKGISLRRASEMIADSMHRARNEEVPFSAFCAVRILNNGQFAVYTYEAVCPILIKDGIATALKQHFHSTGSETIGESFGTLDFGDGLIICSDGVSEAGTGNGYSFGIEVQGIVDFINSRLEQQVSMHDLPDEIVSMSAKVSRDMYADDTTCALLGCREAEQLTIMSGPPVIKARDRMCTLRFLSKPGKHVVCGSTTADIVARESGKSVRLLSESTSFGSPPEYYMDGIDMVTEGAILLNQAYNILDVNPENYTGDSAAERFCMLLHKADAVTFIVGGAVNNAHSDLLFKQMGIKPRIEAVRLIAEQLRKMGKLIVEEYY